MTPPGHALLLFGLAGLSFLALGSALVAVLRRPLSARLARLAPRHRHAALVGLALGPLGLATALLASASLPALIALAAPATDHCGAHDDAHVHLCFSHPPATAGHAGALLALVFVGAYAAFRAGAGAIGVARAAALVRGLERAGRRRADLGVEEIDTDEVFCFTAGLLRPRVFASRGLLDALGPTERSIVLAHEQAHARRRDALSLLVVRAAALLHVPGVGHWLIDEAALAAEQAADEEAARVSGDRLSVASAILAVERAAHGAPHGPPLAVAFGAHAVGRRVEALLAEPVAETPPRGLRLALAGAGLSLLVAADEVHHLTESALSILAH